ncbi:MAG: 2-oxoacid:acceptor oxidoreductase subunit alpha [Bacteroidota bacterium]|nr:2-oxoacid:acceptor oxidoreductase subunit alpha [Bacteroidota bacterium]
MAREKKRIELEDVTVRFAGDSGDGMQLSGTLFSDTAALAGNDLFTFPDYPAEIRAPHNTIAGVSGFQVHLGKKQIFTSGDLADVLVAFNPAALKSNIKWTKLGGTIIVDADAFDEKAIEKAGYTSNPLKDKSLSDYNLIKAPIGTFTKESVAGLEIDIKSIGKSRNMFALGMLYFLFNRELKATEEYIEKKFKKSPVIVEANKRVLRAGFNYADTIEAISSTYLVPPAEMKKGKYRNITGNVATAWGFLAASERSGRELYLGSYPITPATEILQELTHYKEFSAKAFQAEDEIAGICSAIGASYTGSLAITTTSGPGLSLKSEAMGLAVMTELPIVIVDVQRSGPSTGVPTKSEQSDLLQALFGRNGECPLIVLAASTPANCFEYAYLACKLAMEHMTPVILLTDGYIANGAELWRIPKVSELPEIKPPLAKANDSNYKPYLRDEVKLNRQWALPGTEGLRHRVGGLEKENIYGNVCQEPMNHQLMCELRAEKVNRVANYIPDQQIIGEESGDLLVVSWGGTYGQVLTAVKEMQKQGKKVSLAHFNYISPLPKNTGQVLSKFKKIVVCELNLGQFIMYLRMMYPEYKYEQYNKIQGLPFMVSELTEKFKQLLEGK